MAASAFTTEQLIDGLSILPQELYDQIKSLVLSIDDEPYVRELDIDYKQPVQLQLNKETRHTLMEKYYGDGAIWTVEENMGCSWYIMCKWIVNLSTTAQRLLRTNHSTNRLVYPNDVHYFQMKGLTPGMLDSPAGWTWMLSKECEVAGCVAAWKRLKRHLVAAGH